MLRIEKNFLNEKQPIVMPRVSNQPNYELPKIKTMAKNM